MPANDQPNYSFLAWMRRGIAGLADANSLSAKDAVTIPLFTDAIGEGKPPVEIKQTITLYGPGHITGIDNRSIVRTIPRNGVRNFEANFLCAIEFYDEDFPWRYTPLLPVNGKLAPWLWLVVLKQDEFERVSITEGSLPAIEIFSSAMSKAFPDPDTTWAWAHTHLNFTIEGATIAEQQNYITTKLDENPNLGCSRLICPRHLQPSANYKAFLIPAFEKGRLAGLGKEDELINAVPNAQASWATISAATIFPVYYEWEFVTQSRGDFESLARLLSPLNEEESKNLARASLTMDITKPGWGLAYKGTTPSIPVESALKPINQQAYTLLTNSETNEDKNFTAAIADLLNLGIASPVDINNTIANPFFDNSTLEDDPVIVPPLYGSFYRDNPLQNNPVHPAKSNAGRPVKDWYNQLNLNPAFRVAAGKGTSVIQKDQEIYMDRAWDQLNMLNEERLLVKRWHYSLEISNTFFKKRINPVVSAGQATDNAAGSAKAYRTLSLMAPMHKTLAIENKSFTQIIKTRPMSSVYTASFNKITRPGGPVVNRLNTAAASAIGASAAGATAATTTISGTFLNAILLAEAIVIVQRNYLLEILQKIISEFNVMKRFRFGSVVMDEKDEMLRSEGLAGFNQCEKAFINLLSVFKKEIIPAIVVLSDIKLYTAIAAQINPAATLPARLKGMLPAKAAGSIDINSSSIAASAPEFTEAMYRPLAEQSIDFILPGLSEILPNKVALLKTNQPFIESYMVGLNHEMSREYLWREFPAPLNATSFRQFWDARNNPNAATNPDAYKDIKVIAAWGTNELGKNPSAGKASEKMVVLVRGDLLRKYPNTEIYMHKAKWVGNNTKPREPETTINDSTVKYPLFAAHVDPDYQFLGFDIDPNIATGIDNDPGWYFVMKERAGDIHFGLDIDPGNTNPSWAALENETPENSCINVSSAGFKNLPQYPMQLGERSDRFAKMLFQQPFQLFVHASRMVTKQ